MPRPTLTLGHSPDPDDAFMWWPITGMVHPDGIPQAGGAGRPTIDTGRFDYRAVPADIETLNRRAAGDADLDITALSARAWADAAGRYTLTSCGASFGNGYGPKVVVRMDSTIKCDWCIRAQKPVIAVPGRRTTAFLVLGLLIAHEFESVEMPFDRILGAVARGEVGAGLVIHEGQLTFGDLGLRQVADLGEWWKEDTGLPLPLGLNAVRRDLDERFGAGSAREVAAVLRRSIEHALAHRERSLEYACSFAMASEGGAAATPERIETFVGMYVNQRTLDMGPDGRQAIERLLSRGHAAGLCPAVGPIETL
ncbi:MAG: MqnA/MqnD/SBP family protein [Phycisphaerales bacterium]